MEQRFGHDFSQVRVHSGAAAEQSAQDVNAHAYAVGHSIVFGTGRFAPGAFEGRRLIAHELVHVMQQRNTAPVIRRKPRDDPYAPERGVGMLEEINQAAAQVESEKRFSADPSVYDVDYIPEVEVVPEAEIYRFDFGVGEMNIEQACGDQYEAVGCVRVQGVEQRPKVDVVFRDQTLGGTVLRSPLGVCVTSFPVRFTLVIPVERLGEPATVNHEFSHLIDYFFTMQSFKARLARTIRGQLAANRRAAAKDPRGQASLISEQAIVGIIEQAYDTYVGKLFDKKSPGAFRKELLRLGAIVDELDTALPKAKFPAGLRQPPSLKAGTRGELYDPPKQPCQAISDLANPPSPKGGKGAPPRIQRFSAQSSGQMDAAAASVDQALASPGRPLEPALRQDMEQHFGYDFSRVRVHTDAKAAESARAMNALAYTLGREVVFGAGQYAPESSSGKRLLAHELAHVVQQAAIWPTGNTPAIQRQARPQEDRYIPPSATAGRLVYAEEIFQQSPEVRPLSDANFTNIFYDRNKVIVVDFWASWCRPCDDAAAHVAYLARRYASGPYAGLVKFYHVQLEDQANPQLNKRFGFDAIPVVYFYYTGTGLQPTRQAPLLEGSIQGGDKSVEDYEWRIQAILRRHGHLVESPGGENQPALQRYPAGRKPGEPMAVSASGDRYELEAERAADAVMRRRLAPLPRAAAGWTPSLQRQPVPKTGSKKKDDNPFGPQRGQGLVQAIDESVRAQESVERLRQNPGVFDPSYIPPVTVKLAREDYFYDFSIARANLDQVCLPPDLATNGCVMIDAPDFDTGVDVQFRDQSLNGTMLHSPLEVLVTSFPVRSRLYVAREDVNDGETLNHELHHLAVNYHLFGVFKERVARAIRNRVMANRRQAAKTPQRQDALIGKAAIQKIAEQEQDPFVNALGKEYQRRHKEEVEDVTLGKFKVPPTWRNFKMPPAKPGTRGSFT
jgi:thiol-disulfide isomerase/thioredoxin